MTATEAWKSLLPKDYRCPCHKKNGRMFITHKPGTELLEVRMVCLAETPSLVYHHQKLEGDDVLKVVENSSFPLGSLNTVTLLKEPHEYLPK